MKNAHKEIVNGIVTTAIESAAKDIPLTNLDDRAKVYRKAGLSLVTLAAAVNAEYLADY